MEDRVGLLLWAHFGIYEREETKLHPFQGFWFRLRLHKLYGHEMVLKCMGFMAIVAVLTDVRLSIAVALASLPSTILLWMFSLPSCPLSSASASSSSPSSLLSFIIASNNNTPLRRIGT